MTSPSHASCRGVEVKALGAAHRGVGVVALVDGGHDDGPVLDLNEIDQVDPATRVSLAGNSGGCFLTTPKVRTFPSVGVNIKNRGDTGVASEGGE